MLEGPDCPFVYVSSAALAHGMVYFVSGYPEQSIYALNALSGSLQWSQPIGQATPLGFSSSPTVGDSIVWVGSGEGTLYAFHALTGAPIWSLHLGSPIVSCPTVSDGKLWVGTWGGDLLCLQPSQEILASGEAESAEFTQLLPNTYALLPPSPNPFTSTTLISYSVPSAVDRRRTAVSLAVYDLSGRMVRTLVNETLTTDHLPLTTAVSWDGKDGSGQRVPAGIYFIKLRVGNLTIARKAVLLR